MRKQNASKWFHRKASPWNIKWAMTAKTIRLTHSWMTLSWTRENGPPLPTKPIRLAGNLAAILEEGDGP